MYRFEENTYIEWVAQVDEICEFNLRQNLLTRDKETRYIAVNFDPKVMKGRLIINHNNY